MRLLLIVSACVLMACQSDSESDDTKTATNTWHNDVKPLVDNYCIRCHTEAISASVISTTRTPSLLWPTSC